MVGGRFLYVMHELAACLRFGYRGSIDKVCPLCEHPSPGRLTPNSEPSWDADSSSSCVAASSSAFMKANVNNICRA